MDFRLTEEQKMLQETVRRFVNEKLLPLEQEALAKSPAPKGHRNLLDHETEKKLQQFGKEIGLWALFVPPKYGGAGLGYVEFCLVSEELEKTFIPFNFGGDAPEVLCGHSKELEERYFLPCARGEKIWCFAQTEPDAGSDSAAIQTTAVRKGDHWVINGTKMMISRADVADFALVPTVTDKQRRARGGITMFCVDRQTPATPQGYKVTRLIETMGDFVLGELAFEDCVVPATNIVGEVGQGFIVAQNFLTTGFRLHHGAWALGIAERCQQMAVEHARQRLTFGKPLGERQAIQWMLADSAMEIYATKLMVYNFAWRADQGENVRNDVAMLKVYGDEMVQRVTHRTVQIFGGLGYCADLPVERFYRNARMMTIGGGTAEMMRMMIARSILKA